MNTSPAGTSPFAVILVLAFCHVLAQTPPSAPSLGGTSWQLVKVEGGDGKTLTPDNTAKYTIAFGEDGRVSARIDCNRGASAWKSAGSGQLQFGPLALTRMMCPPGSLHDRVVKDWTNVRSYVIKDGHLFLSLMADGGGYEFEPLTAAKPGPAKKGLTGTASRAVIRETPSTSRILQGRRRPGARRRSRSGS